MLAAASGSEAIEMLERDRPDVVICDVVLPDKDGYQICQYVLVPRGHRHDARAPHLGIDNGTVQARAAEVRSDEVLFKPFGVDDPGSRKIDRLLSSRANGAPSRENGSTPPERDRAATPAFAPRPLHRWSGRDTARRRRLALGAAPGNQGASRGSRGHARGSLRRADRSGRLPHRERGDLSADTDEVAGALASCLAEASDGIGRELGQGQLARGRSWSTRPARSCCRRSGLRGAAGRPGRRAGRAQEDSLLHVRKVVPELARLL